MPQSTRPPQQIKPIHVLIACLCVALALFAGSLAIGWAAWQANKSAGIQTDQQDQTAQ